MFIEESQTTKNKASGSLFRKHSVAQEGSIGTNTIIFYVKCLGTSHRASLLTLLQGTNIRAYFVAASVTNKKKRFHYVDTSGLYYKPITIINDDFSVVSKLETLVIDDARVVIYNRHVFIVQSTGVDIVCFTLVRISIF